MGSKNITLAIDEDLLQRARVLAAMRRTSVNEMVREFLADEVGSAAQDARRAEWQAFFGRVDAAATDDQRHREGGLPLLARRRDGGAIERGLS